MLQALCAPIPQGNFRHQLRHWCATPIAHSLTTLVNTRCPTVRQDTVNEYGEKTLGDPPLRSRTWACRVHLTRHIFTDHAAAWSQQRDKLSIVTWALICHRIRFKANKIFELERPAIWADRSRYPCMYTMQAGQNILSGDAWATTINAIAANIRIWSTCCGGESPGVLSELDVVAYHESSVEIAGQHTARPS